MTVYATSCIFYLENPDILKNLSFGNNYRLDYRINPYNLYWVDKDGSESSLIKNKEANETEIIELSIKYKPAYELLIECSSDIDAENICNLLYCSELLKYPQIIKKNFYPYKIENNFSGYIDIYLDRTIFFNFLLNIEIVMNSVKLGIEYCLEKYSFSLSLDSLSPHSTNPIYGQIFSIESRENHYHVTSGTSLFSAISIIEELGLEIRSSSKNPRFLDKKGTWNPSVYDNVKVRLSEIGVSPDKEWLWIIRGEEKSLYYKVEPIFGEASEYNSYPLNFDKNLKVIELLHYCSYIRNFFIGHKLSETIKVITPYDVFNVQNFIRFLLLNKLGIWETLSTKNS
ncbi:hypothetical protein [Streptococcus parauberis]|uniref:hypothetical protein n=1 Tax=Streptococcus parauberis TaxID=1348 RepID=UPI0037B9667E